MAKATKLSSGNWRCKGYYTDEQGNYTSKSFTAETKKEAEYMAAQFLMEMKHKKKPENKTIGELLDLFIEGRSNILSPSTIVGYKKIRRTAMPKLMETRAGFVTQQMYQAFLNEYAKNRSPKTVREAHSLIARVFKEYHVDIDSQAVLLPQKINKEPNPPTIEEIKIILEAGAKKDIYLPILFAALLGLRKSEIFALTWDDIDIDNQTIRINKATVKNEFGEYVIKTTKTRSSTRTLYLPQAIINALPAREPGKDTLLGISPDAFDSRYKRVIAKLGYKFNFHLLRHAYATEMHTMGIPDKSAMALMGHATDNMLKQVYQHDRKDRHNEYQKMIEARFAEHGI